MFTSLVYALAPVLSQDVLDMSDITKVAQGVYKNSTDVQKRHTDFIFNESHSTGETNTSEAEAGWANLEKVAGEAVVNDFWSRLFTGKILISYEKASFEELTRVISYGQTFRMLSTAS